MQIFSRSSRRALDLLLLALALTLLTLHFVHLQADFPNHSRWMDWSKYTDEGWYGDAAIRHFERGHWYVPGDFNPAVALPVLPLLEGLLFACMGVSLSGVRALTVGIFAGILVLSWLLITRHSRLRRSSLAASAAVLLLAANPFCFVLTRMAILEPLLILLMLLALVAASRVLTGRGPVPHPAAPRKAIHFDTKPIWTILALGVLLPLLILTKTTALFLTPAIFWILWASSGFRVQTFVRVAAPTIFLALSLWLGYFLFVVRPHLLLDYRYLFSANAYTAMTGENFIAVLAGTLKDGRWMGTATYCLALAAALFALARPSRLRDHPLIVALLLWIGGYFAFLAYHNNLQPRYYLVVAVPLALLLPIVVEELIVPDLPLGALRPSVLAAAWLAFASIVIADASQTLAFIRHPDYTLVQAAAGVKQYIARDGKIDPTHNPLLLSISGSDISLMTGLPSICDDFGTAELADRVKQYNPGWYAAWNQIDDDKMDSLWPQFTLERVAAFAAMDDPDRNQLILYKLYAAGSPTPMHRGRPSARRAAVKHGQQPSLHQLGH